MIKKIIILCIALLGIHFSLMAQYQLKSPDNKIVVSIELGNDISFSVDYNQQSLLKKGTISLELSNKILGEHPKLIRSKKRTINETVYPVVPLKNSVLKNNCNVITLFFEDEYQIEFRAYNNGIAYRFITTNDGEITIVKEQADYQFADNYKGYLSKTERKFSSYEHVFKPVWLQDFQKDDLAIIPVFLDAVYAKVLISEADLHDYPAIFIQGGEGNQVSGWQPKYPEKTEPIVGTWRSDRRLKISKEADYIAKTSGNRSFPWRVFALASEDKDIVTNDLVYLLSRPSEYKDFSWIKPGQTSWEWWHASNITGVDFKSGLNTKTYKYYVDFADKYNLEYVLLDEGWSKSVTDISEPNPDIDLKELISYAKQKNVDIILWASWLTIENTPDFFKQVSNMGVKGVKIDFMDRSDQWMMNYYERIAKRAFENKLLIDFHGSITPRGLRRAYPNIISYEGVTGMEQNKVGGFDLPNNHVILPFTRNVVGPMDYTPGAMRSVHPKYWSANWANPMSIGTRAHQLALFVVFESALQMLADNPSYYYKEPECTGFIAGVPTTWDETLVLDGRIGQYYVVAKRKGKDWFIGGITAGNRQEFTIDLSFLENAKNYQMTLFKDGVNAEKNALDYKKNVQTITSKDKVTIKMVKNGGFAAKISK